MERRGAAASAGPQESQPAPSNSHGASAGSLGGEDGAHSGGSQAEQAAAVAGREDEGQFSGRGTGGSVSATVGKELEETAAEGATTMSGEGLPLGAAGEEGSGAGGSGVTPGSVRQRQQQQQGRAYADIPPIKDRVRWTPALHQLFVDAVDRLGGPLKAKPKEIMVEMKVPHLSLNHIKSHLQKHRAVEAAAKRQTEQQQQQQNSFVGLALRGFQGLSRAYSHHPEGDSMDTLGELQLPFKRERLEGHPTLGLPHAGGLGPALIEQAYRPMQVYQAAPTNVVLSGSSLPHELAGGQAPLPTWHVGGGLGPPSHLQPPTSSVPYPLHHPHHPQQQAQPPPQQQPQSQQSGVAAVPLLLQQAQAAGRGWGRGRQGEEIAEAGVEAVQVARQLLQRRQQLLELDDAPPPPLPLLLPQALGQPPALHQLPQQWRAGPMRAPPPLLPPGAPATLPQGRALLEQLLHMAAQLGQQPQQPQQEVPPPLSMQQFSSGDRQVLLAAVHLLPAMQKGQGQAGQQPLPEPAPMAIDEPEPAPVVRSYNQLAPPPQHQEQQQQGQGQGLGQGQGQGQGLMVQQGSNSRPSAEDTTWQATEWGSPHVIRPLQEQQLAPPEAGAAQQHHHRHRAHHHSHHAHHHQRPQREQAPEEQPEQQAQQAQQQQQAEQQVLGSQEGMPPLHRGGRAPSPGWHQQGLPTLQPPRGVRFLEQQAQRQEEQLTALLEAAAAARQAPQAPAEALRQPPSPQAPPREASISSAAAEDPDAAMAAATAALLAGSGLGGEAAAAAGIMVHINELQRGAGLAEKLVHWHLAVAEAVREDVRGRMELHVKAEEQLRVSSDSLLQVAQSLGATLLLPPPPATAHADAVSAVQPSSSAGPLREQLAALQALGLLPALPALPLGGHRDPGPTNLGEARQGPGARAAPAPASEHRLGWRGEA